MGGGRRYALRRPPLGRASRVGRGRRALLALGRHGGGLVGPFGGPRRALGDVADLEPAALVLPLPGRRSGRGAGRDVVLGVGRRSEVEPRPHRSARRGSTASGGHVGADRLLLEGRETGYL